MNSQPTRSAYRILDASINRVTEGIRTLEECARFDVEDLSLTEAFKTIRHDLTAAVRQHLSREALLGARDTPGDIGTSIEGAAEYTRETMGEVIAAASSRVQQSLRVIEEYGKTMDPSFAKCIEQIRYRSYQACASLELRLTATRRSRLLGSAQLYLLISAGSSEQEFVTSLTKFSDAGVDIFQLRDKQVDDRTLYERACAGAKTARDLGRLFIVNDRPDIAVAADADGVHVGQDELPALIARSIVGDRRLVGVSTHSLGQATDAEAAGADYIGCGPVFSGRTKQFDDYVGTAFLSEVTQSTRVPAFAIGGIDHKNITAVTEAGFTRVAVTGAIRDAEDPVLAASEMKQRLRVTE